MSIKALQEYTRFSKYARFDASKSRRETWEEQVKRVFDMHRKKLGEDKLAKFKEDFELAERMMLQKRVLGSQRALQFGGDPILKKHARLYNCTASYCDRPRFFQECMFLLLCGCGTGFSVQKHHVAKLPSIISPARQNKGTKVFQIPDDIEGWADSIGVLLSSYMVGSSVPFPEYHGYKVEFDFSKIRPAGSPLSSGSKAPGPDGLRTSLIMIDYVLDKAAKLGDRLKPIDAYDIVMHASDAVLSGGVRRSATICLFSADDDEMAKAKTGSWFIENPQRGRSNNSVILLRDKTEKESFQKLIESVKQFGEPGFVWADDLEALINPCGEIGLFAKLILNKEMKSRFANEMKIQNNEKELSGWAFCNLCEINVKKCRNEEEFLETCRAASVLGTIQASYTTFEYLGHISEEIVKREALLGVSMTGMADNPDIAFDPKLQRKGAKVILETNEKVAAVLGINPSARSTCIKPAGTSSCVLGTASGIHPHHAKRYFRRVQANKMETPLKYFQKFNPMAVEESVWSNNKTDMVLTFLCEVPDGVKTKNKVDAITLLDSVKLTQQNWVEAGTREDLCVKPWLRHNVSNTINILPDEWENVTDYIYKNRKWFTGISMLPMSGDKDYPQAPFTAVYTPSEIVKEYGDGSMFASGLIVDGLRAFDNNLWAASDCVLGIGEIITVDALKNKIERDCRFNGEKWKQEGLSPSTPEKLLQAWMEHNIANYNEKVDWVRRAKQFAKRYFQNDLRKMTYCLKDVANWKVWCDLSREYKEIDWDQCFEDAEGHIYTAGYGQAGEACSGNTSCDLGELGLVMAEKIRENKKEVPISH